MTKTKDHNEVKGDGFEVQKILIYPDGRMSIEEASKYLGCAQSSLMRKKDEFKYVKVMQKLYFFKDDLDDWIKRQVPGGKK
jgi:hypothetical protein